MDVVEPPVSTGLFSICDPCGTRMMADFDENPSREGGATRESRRTLLPLHDVKE